VGFVGQNLIEEIDVVEEGKNYGWNIMEGSPMLYPSNRLQQDRVGVAYLELYA
jgi:glucose/arabinose dehydrogenase